jgi:hypothetical protein
MQRLGLDLLHLPLRHLNMSSKPTAAEKRAYLASAKALLDKQEAEKNGEPQKVTLPPELALVVLYMDLAVHILAGMANQLGGPASQPEAALTLERIAKEVQAYRESFLQRAAMRVQLAQPVAAQIGPT